MDFAHKKNDYACKNKISRFPVTIYKFLLAILFAVLLILFGQISNIEIIIDKNNEYSSFRKVRNFFI